MGAAVTGEVTVRLRGAKLLVFHTRKSDLDQYADIYKDDLFPTFAFRQAWEKLDGSLSDRKACKEFVKILKDAARPDGEKVVNEYLETCLREGRLPSSAAVKALFIKQDTQVPKLREQSNTPADYDILLNLSREVIV